MWGSENHVNFNKMIVLAGYVAKRLHVPKGTTKFLESESIIYPNHAFSPKTVLITGLFSKTKSREVSEWYSAPAWALCSARLVKAKYYVSS